MLTAPSLIQPALLAQPIVLLVSVVLEQSCRREGPEMGPLSGSGGPSLGRSELR